MNRPERDDVVLAVDGLTKRYGRRIAVRGVDLQLRRGRITGLLGPNGAGKSTVLRLLFGLVRPDAGRVLLDGHELSPDLPRGRVGIAGFVDAPTFVPYLSAQRNLELLAAWDGPASTERVADMLALVGLGDRANDRVRGFSTGMRQRLGLAAALVGEPRVLILDEPTSGLDPAGVRDVHALLAGLAEAGCTILLSSHDLTEVERLCSEVVVLREGRSVFADSIEDMRRHAGRRVWTLDTADNDSAVLHGARCSGVSLSAGGDGMLTLSAEPADVDAFVLGLAAQGLAVRELRRERLGFPELFFQLTEATPAAVPAARGGNDDTEPAS